MAHFAKIDSSGIVLQVYTGTDNDNGKELELSARTGDTYRQTSYNTRGGIYYKPNGNEPSEDQSKAFRKNYAGKGFTYDEDRDAFIEPQPYPSWILNEDTCRWEAPVPHPDDGQRYDWNEETTSWDLVE
jgi:hypothetical protein